MFLLFGGLIFFMVLVLGGFFIWLEMRFIKKRSKWEKILPMIVTVFAVITFVMGHMVTSTTNLTHYYSISDNEKYFGELQLVQNSDKETIAIGFLKFDDKVQYLELQFDNGKLIGSREALKYEKLIYSNIGKHIKGFTGSSVDFEEIRKISNEKTAKFEIMGLSNSIFYLIFSIVQNFIVPVILWLMLLITSKQRKKRNQLDKSKLADL